MTERWRFTLLTGLVILLAFGAVALWAFASGPAEPSALIDFDQTTHIFFSAGCADCWPYVEEELLPTLQANRLASQYQVHDYTRPDERALLLNIADNIALPRAIADSLYAFIPTKSGTLVILGHVPPDLIQAAATHPALPTKLVLWQPEMHGPITKYHLWAWTGKLQTFSIDYPFDQALANATAAQGPLPTGDSNLRQLLPAVLVTGMLDSVNPCAFAVILLLIAFLFTLRHSRAKILQLGLVYILVIFWVYFAIGLGLLSAIQISGEPHFVARAGSWLLIGLGLINLLEYFAPEFPIKLHMPRLAGDKTNELIRRGTLPATIAAGFLVGLCTFPCSGGIYVSIITLLNAKTTLAWGVLYLAIYNIMFVLPLLFILLVVGNRATAKAWASWEREHSLKIRLGYGLGMVALGASMLIWIIP